jgi:hypothetical protein
MLQAEGLRQDSPGSPRSGAPWVSGSCQKQADLEKVGAIECAVFSHPYRVG